MAEKAAGKLKDGDQCKVVGGTHNGKSGTIRDINTSKTGHITILVVQENGVRFKTLGKNVVVLKGGGEALFTINAADDYKIDLDGFCRSKKYKLRMLS